jgi:hypothetical protein
MSIVALKQREWSNGYGCLFSDICPLEAGSFSLGHLSGLLALVVSDIWNELYILCLIQSVILVSTQSRSLLLHFRNTQSCNLKNWVPGLDNWDHVSWILHSANTTLRNLASKMNLICWLVKSEKKTSCCSCDMLQLQKCRDTIIIAWQVKCCNTMETPKIRPSILIDTSSFLSGDMKMHLWARTTIWGPALVIFS